jgi:hypothetical protein
MKYKNGLRKVPELTLGFRKKPAGIPKQPKGSSGG